MADPFAAYGGQAHDTQASADPFAAYGGVAHDTSQPPEKPGFFKRLGQSIGIPTSQQELQNAVPQSIGDTLDMLTPGGVATKLIQNYANTAGQGFRQGFQEAGEADQMRKQGLISTPQAIGKTASAALNATVNAIPIIGPSMVRAGEDISQGNYRGAAGGLTGVVGTVAAPELAKRTGQAISNALPSTERAGAVLGQVKAAAGDIPIDMTKPGNTALELYTQSQRGATLPKSVRDLLNRVTKPDSQPLTYAEAKDFQSNISRLSADEYKRMNPNTKRLVGQLNADLKSSLEGAADTVGKGQQFTDAMREYHNAMRIKGFSDKAIDLAIKAAIGTVLGGVTGAAGYKVYKMLGE